MERFYVEETFGYMISAKDEAEAREIQANVTIIGDDEHNHRIEFVTAHTEKFESNKEFDTT